MRNLAIVLCCVVLAGPAAAAEPTNPDEMMKAYEMAARPGPEHALLAQAAGQWTCSVKSWMDPNGEPMVSAGTEESEMIFDGRFLQSRFKSTMMGQPYEGRGMMGYDKGKKKYVGTWMDSMGTGIMSYEGDYNAATKEIVSRGSYVDPISGQEQACRMVTRIVSDDQHVFEMWGPDPTGKDVKWMEISYTRTR